MNRENIIAMAREAGFGHFHAIGCRANAWGECDMGCNEQIERFANLVAAKEREACARVCDEASEYGEGAWLVANRIRARWCND